MTRCWWTSASRARASSLLRELSIRKDADPSEVVNLGDKTRGSGPSEGGQGRPSDPVQEARRVRARLDLRRGEVQGRRDRHRRGHRGRQGRPDPGHRPARLPAGIPRWTCAASRIWTCYLGTELEARVIEMDRNRNNVVLSRRVLLEEGRKNERAEILAKLVQGHAPEGHRLLHRGLRCFRGPGRHRRSGSHLRALLEPCQPSLRGRQGGRRGRGRGSRRRSAA